MVHEPVDPTQFVGYVRREAAFKWAAWGAVGGLGCAVPLNVVAWAFPILTLEHRLALSLGIAALWTLVAFLTAYLYPRSLAAIARISDARLHLYARLATALEIQTGLLPVSPELAALQLADARAAAESADPKRAFALRFPRRQSLIAAVLSALLITGFVLPNPQEARIAARQAEREAIAEQIERLEGIRQEIAANDELSQEDKEVLLRELDDAIDDLREGKLSKGEAVARLSEMEERLAERLADDVDAQEAALRKAGYQAALGESTQETGQALSQGDYRGAAQALSSLGTKLDEMSAEELEATAQRLGSMAEDLSGAHPELAQALRDAAEAMRRGDTDAARQALERAAELTQQAGQQIAAQEATEQALGQIQESQRQIAQAGQEQRGQGQQGGETQGQGPGQQGQGQSGSGSGRGDAGEQDEHGPPGAPQGPIPPNQPGQEGEKPYDPIYVPQRLGEGEGERIDLPGQGDGGLPTGETEGHTPDEGQVLVPYNEVYTDYQAQAASALENSYIPRGMKEYVRAYFSSLEPGK